MCPITCWNGSNGHFNTVTHFQMRTKWQKSPFNVCVVQKAIIPFRKTISSVLSLLLCHSKPVRFCCITTNSIIKREWIDICWIFSSFSTSRARWRWSWLLFLFTRRKLVVLNQQWQHVWFHLCSKSLSVVLLVVAVPTSTIWISLLHHFCLLAGTRKKPQLFYKSSILWEQEIHSNH